MFVIFIGAMAAALGLAGITHHHPTQPVPDGSYVVAHGTAGAPNTLEAVTVKPESEVKFANIARQQYDYSCGSAALVTVLNAGWGMNVSEKEAMEGMLEHGERERIIARRGFSLLDMKRFLASKDVASAGYRIPTKDLHTLDRPAILTVNYGGFSHFVVLRDIKGRRAYIADPALGHYIVDIDELHTIRDRDAVFVVKPQDPFPRDSKLSLSEGELAAIDPDRLHTDIDLTMGRQMLLQDTISSTINNGWSRSR